LNPKYVKALNRRAHLYEDLDKPHEAMKDFNQVLEIDKGNVEANKAVMVRLKTDKIVGHSNCLLQL
jgi:regulator of sirC expression with transglutaminase-like and TPR domain